MVVLAFLPTELDLPEVRELYSGVAGELFLRVGEGFLFVVELTLLAGELPLVVNGPRDGELPLAVIPVLAGEVPLVLAVLPAGDQPVPVRAGELPLADGEAPRVLVLPVEGDGVASNGPLPRLPVLARRPGEDEIVEALEYVGEEFFTALDVVPILSLLAEIDLVVDGELDRIEGVETRGEDDFVDVDRGDEEPLELYDDTVVGLGLFVEVLNAGRGLFAVGSTVPGRGLLEGLGFRLGAAATGSLTLDTLCDTKYHAITTKHIHNFNNHPVLLHAMRR